MIVEFDIHVSMEERWIPYFMSFLKEMEHDGDIGHSALLGFLSDGDGDFRPEFKTDFKYEPVDGIKTKEIPEIMFDAG